MTRKGINIMATTKLTKADIANWVGGDHLNVDELLGLLTKLANGKYTPEQFNEDVSDLIEE